MCYSCTTTTYKGCQIGLGVGVQKNVMVNEIVGFGGLDLVFIYFK
jgi:hypothetical protein